MCNICYFFFFQAEDGIRDLVRSRGLGDVYKRQGLISSVVIISPNFLKFSLLISLGLIAKSVIHFFLSLIHI